MSFFHNFLMERYIWKAILLYGTKEPGFYTEFFDWGGVGHSKGGCLCIPPNGGIW